MNTLPCQTSQASCFKPRVFLSMPTNCSLVTDEHQLTLGVVGPTVKITDEGFLVLLAELAGLTATQSVAAMATIVVKGADDTVLAADDEYRSVEDGDISDEEITGIWHFMRGSDPQPGTFKYFLALEIEICLGDVWVRRYRLSTQMRVFRAVGPDLSCSATCGNTHEFTNLSTT